VLIEPWRNVNIHQQIWMVHLGEPAPAPKMPPDAGRLPRLDRRRHKPMRHVARIQVVPHYLVQIVDRLRGHE
jgi:hypothetical protein